MTTDRDFDRLARAWLELGPDEAPERTVAAILQATETLPQVRRRFRWPAWRELTMSRSPLLIGVWATVLIAVAGIALLNRTDRNNNAGTPTNAPSTIASGPPASAVATGPLDPRLVGQWMGDGRPIKEIPHGGGTRLIFTDFGASYFTPANSPTDNHLTSTASTAEGTLRLFTGNGLNNGCSMGDVGNYVWSVSPSGRVLHIDATSDRCVPRIASVVGTWWRIGCHVLSDGCLGDLEAGRYQTAFITFREPADNQLPVAYGNLTYTVPDGWANSADWDAGFGLMPSDEFARVYIGSDVAYHQIVVFAHPAIAAQDAGCSAANEPGVEQTAAGMIRAITHLPGVTASTPTPISIGLLSGQMVDLRLSPSWTGICPDRIERSAPVLNEVSGGGERWSSVMSVGESWRLIIVELGGGNLAAIVVSDAENSPSRFDQFVAEAMPIVQSLQFK